MRPIAMKCTQENWDEIKPILKDNGIEVSEITSFNYCSYLVSNYGGFRSVSNIFDSTKNGHGRKVYEEWDKNIFLEACGIKVKYTIEDLRNGKCAAATEEEIAKAKCPYKDGDLLWVRYVDKWILRYSNGTLDNRGRAMCYINQQKSGTVGAWKLHKPATNITLPNE